MRKIRVICVGGKLEAYLRQGIEHYSGLLRRYCDFRLQTVKEARYAAGNRQEWLNEEAERLNKQAGKETRRIACDENGCAFSSSAFAYQLQDWANRGQSGLDFFVGGPHGLSERFKQSADTCISLSPMTMTHQMVRLVLVEQLYRAFTIINNERYHHV
jgi:23S rRNA (pseudouridine1915-N3)-methyltransferase